MLPQVLNCPVLCEHRAAIPNGLKARTKTPDPESLESFGTTIRPWLDPPPRLL
jgi:hypothetical protein